MKSRNLTFICNSSDLIDRLSIIRGLRSALGLRIIGCRVCCNGILVRLILDVVVRVILDVAVILVFGVFARGITGVLA